MVARLLTLLLLLSPAIGTAAPPVQPDNSPGRIAFNRLLEQAEAAWQESRTEEALRCYQIAKKMARTHKLKLSGRDEALMAFITRHEAGQTHEQTGRQAGCETDLTAAGPIPTKKTLPRAIPGPADSSKKPLVPKDSTQEPKTGVVIPEIGSPSAPVIDGPTRTLVPPVRPSLREPSLDSTKTNILPTVDTPASAIAIPALAPGTNTARNQQKKTVPRPSVDEAQPKAAAAEARSTGGDGELVPVVTPPAAETTELPTPAPQDGQTLIPKADSPAATEAAPEKEADVQQQPVKLTADRQAISIGPPETGHPDALAVADPVPSTGMPSAAPGPISDRHLTLMMFGPIVLALFLLGLLTQEMPSPRRVAAWISRKRRGPQPVAETPVDPTSLIAAAPAATTTKHELPVTISAKRQNKVLYYTATIELPGVEPARIIKRRDSSPQYRSRAAALSSARRVARRLGYTGVREEVARKKAA